MISSLLLSMSFFRKPAPHLAVGGSASEPHIQPRGACTQSTEKGKVEGLAGEHGARGGPKAGRAAGGGRESRWGAGEAEEAFLANPVKGAVLGEDRGEVLAKQKKREIFKRQKRWFGGDAMFAPHGCVALKG